MSRERRPRASRRGRALSLRGLTSGQLAAQRMGRAFHEDAISHVPALDDPNRDPAQSVFFWLPTICRGCGRACGSSPAGPPGRKSTLTDAPLHHQCPRHLGRRRHGARHGQFPRPSLPHGADQHIWRANTSTSSSRHNGSFKIAERKVILAQDTLRLQGTMSIIV